MDAAIGPILRQQTVGGIWTSTYTPDWPEGFRLDWEKGLRINKIMQMAFPAAAADLPGWVLSINCAPRVLVIGSLEEAQAFTKECHLAEFKLSPERGAEVDKG